MKVIGEDACPGVKQNGFPYLIRRSVECSCPGSAIPASLEVDISGLGLGDSVALSQLTVPENVKIVAQVGMHVLLSRSFLVQRNSALSNKENSTCCDLQDHHNDVIPNSWMRVIADLN